MELNRAVLGAATVALLVYAGVCAAVFVLQRALIYFPAAASDPPEGAERLTLSVDGERVAVTVWNQRLPAALLYFGGNAEDVHFSLPELAAAFPDRALYLMQYRGYGASTGKPSERALVNDALALYDAVAARHCTVAVAGRSLGGAVALRLASARPAERLILITPLDSVADVAARHYPILPVRWLLRDRFDAEPYAPAITVPASLIVAENDEIVPRDSANALLARFRPGVARMDVVAGTGHNTIQSSPAYVQLLSRAAGSTGCPAR